jgi:hypothetical protein
MISLTITEASALVVSSSSWLATNVNPSTPGSSAIPIEQGTAGLFNMLVGELVVTDGLIAFLSHRFEKRYLYSIALEWAELIKKKKSYIWLLVVIANLMSVAVLLQIPMALCLTSKMSNE